MAEEPNAGTAAGDAGTPANAGAGSEAGTGSPSAADLQRMLDEANARAAEAQKRYDEEHRLRLTHQTKVEAANQVLARTAQPPTTDPLEQEIADHERARAELAGQKLSDPVLESNLRRLYAERDQRRNNAMAQSRIEAAKAELPSIPEAEQEGTWNLFMTGRFWTVADAYDAFKGKERDKLRQQLAAQEAETKKREAEVIKAQERAPGSPRGSGHSSTSANRLKTSDYIRKLDQLRESDPAAAKQLVKDKDSGKLVVVADDLA